jgi:hypothetical protein
MTSRSDRGQGAARRATAIMETVERAATGILDEAEEEARRYVEDSRRRAEEEAAERLGAATDLANGLVERAERLRGELDGLIEALGTARVRLEETLEPRTDAPAPAPPAPIAEPPRFDPDPPPAEAQGPGLWPVPEPEPDPDPGPEPQESEEIARSPESRSLSDSGARLLATQMAMAGNDREAVAAHLEREMPAADVIRILDAVFGPRD